MAKDTAIRVHITGVVQGVGFRPFVYNLATGLGLSGWVLNSSSGVEIEAVGPAAVLDEFARRLEAEAPPLSRIEQVNTRRGWSRAALPSATARAGRASSCPSRPT
jgi:hydrogenase maturation protein HypF